MELLSFFDLFLVLGSSVSILSIELNLFLVSIFDVDGSEVWLGRFDNFIRSREDDVGVWSLLDCGECSALLFVSTYHVWFFPRLPILEVEGRIGDLGTFVFGRSGLCLRCSFVIILVENFPLSAGLLASLMFLKLWLYHFCQVKVRLSSR